MPSIKAVSAALALLNLIPQVVSDCQSYGDDFQSGFTYFQNSLSADPFTALQEFEGCQNDVSHNVFVDPAGDQSECTETPMQPDDTPQLVTCSQWPKNKLYNGDWSLLIISNNGNAEPIAFQRDFSLTVGPQITSTVTPTLTVSVIQTPVVNITSTLLSKATDTTTSTATSGRGTQTVTPKAATSTSTRGLLTLTQQTQTYSVVSSTRTVPASCSVQPTRRVQDPIATILPTILGELDNVIENLLGGLGGLIGLNSLGIRDELTASAKFKREIIAGRTPSADLKMAFVNERRQMLEARNVEKRAPDQPTITSTAVAVTSTAINNAPATTQTLTETDFTTTTSTVVVTAGPVTVTLAQVTSVVTKLVPIVQVTKTQTRTTTIVNTVTTTSSGAAQSCASKGGVLQRL
ncbi:hypothetical protein LTR95_010184 [Oleoguttula sp. CCFEE 5521]